MIEEIVLLLRGELNLYYCCIVSRTRLYQFVALYNSIKMNAKSFRIFVLCMDDDTIRILTQAKLDSLSLISLNKIEDKCLLNLKSIRTIDEYCWTLKPIFLLHVLNHNNKINRITYLDSDLYFFDNPMRIFERGKKSAILLSKHDYCESLHHLEKDAGKFNSGIISFRNNSNGKSCLKWWTEKCISWCYNTTVTGQFGDQKYLEDMIRLFKDVYPIDVPGVNIAPWNDGKYKIHAKKEKIYINTHRLIVYHYCGFRICDKNSCIFMFGNKYNPIIHNPYMKAIKNAIHQIQSITPHFDGYFSEEYHNRKFNIFNLQ